MSSIKQYESEPTRVTELRGQVEAKVDSLRDHLIEMNDWMYHNPEPGFLEFGASKMLAESLESNGFVVEMGVPGLEEAWPEFDRLKYVGGLSPSYKGPPGLPTAFRAKYKAKSEKPVVAIVVEYDALRGDPPFHGCQHNMQGPTGVGAAIALAHTMEEQGIPGSVWVIGAPAEEVGPPSKAALAKAGYLDGVDFVMRSHGIESRNETVRYPGGFSERHIEQLKYTFFGKSAHAQMPWNGVSALDSVMLLLNAVEMLREHSEPQFRFHWVISEGGVAPNIVPERASCIVWVRHLIDETRVGSVSPRQAKKMISKKVEQVDNAARGAALATGTRVEIDHYGSYIPGIAVGTYNDLLYDYACMYGGINSKEASVPRHWEETGFMTVLVPGINVGFGIEGVTPQTGHSHESADLTVSKEGHDALVLMAKVMGAIGLRLAMDKSKREQITEEHAMWVKRYNE
jgi:amidohydrolase